MALNNFFKINFPYGIMKNVEGEWTAFNREYKPLGENDSHKTAKKEDFIYSNYGKITDNFLMKLADDPNSIEMNSKNEIIKVFLYNDSNNPSNFDKPSLWEDYLKKVKLLASKKIKSK